MQVKNGLLLLGSIVWLLGMSAGTKIMLDYDYTPGATVSLPRQWPADAQIQPLPGEATLVMAAHPHCSCTRASLEELSVLMTHAQGRLSAYVLFLKPSEFSEGWERTDLWEHAVAIPGVRVIADDEGKEARHFHATVSGQTLLYDAHGELVFSGGITESRGHSGDNAGRDAILSFLTNETAERKGAFAFGCSLF